LSGGAREGRTSKNPATVRNSGGASHGFAYSAYQLTALILVTMTPPATVAIAESTNRAA
jgi:hypothetical protein